MSQLPHETTHTHTTHTVGHTVADPSAVGVAAARPDTMLDRVRWGPIVAGLFVALATLTLLSVLGAAVGLSNVDRNDSPSNFGIGAGVWGAVSALIAFFIGGMVAARTAATPASSVSRDGHITSGNGLLQGLMVWAVAVPLSAYAVASAASGLAHTAGSAMATGVQATATAGQNAVSRPDAADRVANADNGRDAVDRAKQEGAAATQKAGDAASAVGDELQGVKQQVQNAFNGQNVENAASYGARGAWGLLASLVLGLIAAAVGGVIGGKSRSGVVTVTR